MNTELEYIKKIELVIPCRCDQLIECPYCGTSYMRNLFKQHEKSQKHQKNVAKYENIRSHIFIHQSSNAI